MKDVFTECRKVHNLDLGGLMKLNEIGLQYCFFQVVLI